MHLNKLGGPVSNQYFAFFSFTNTSSTPCILDRYPSPNLYDAQGRISVTQEEGPAYPISDPRAHPVQLAPNASAYFGLGWADGNQGDAGSLKGCVTATSLNVFLPDSLASSAVQATLPDICPDGSRQPSVVVTAVALTAEFATLGGPTP